MGRRPVRFSTGVYTCGRFAELDAHVLGCIANDVPHSLAGMFGGGGCGYAYGYGGYGGGCKSYGRMEAEAEESGT